MFKHFASRVTRAYVILALCLIVIVVVVSSVLAFLLYARTLNAIVDVTAQRAVQQVQSEQRRGMILAQAAPLIVRQLERGSVRIVVFDAQHRRLAGSQLPPSWQRRSLQLLSDVIRLPRQRVQVPGGGEILILPDVDRFGLLLFWYWSIMLPVGLFALLIAWLVGRRITKGAVGPLVNVTAALQAIAAGDFTPQRVSSTSGELNELTEAYNDVAFRLTAATSERRETENRMRQFIADAGHELRTPLTVITGYLDVLRQGIVTGDEQTKHVYETMLSEGRRMRDVIQKLLLLARLDRPSARKTASVDLVRIVSAAIDDLSSLANRRIRFEPDAGPAIVSGDEGELREAIKNVLDNALKYGNEAPVDVTLTAEDHQFCVSVRDYGPGMSETDAAHAFDRFYRGMAKGEVEGSGLGLAIAKGGIERAGGSAVIAASDGSGTVIRLCLPRAA